MSRPARPISVRFWEKVDKSAGPDECWLWTGTTRSDGYGVMQIGTLAEPKMIRTNRLALELATGEPVPDELHACHHCDNPPCVNPAHLYAGTRLENMRDMVERRRQRYLARPDCGKGHLWTPETTKMATDGRRRICLVCHPRAASFGPKERRDHAS